MAAVATAAAVAAAPAISASETFTAPSSGAGSIFSGANFSDRRGYIYVPTVETRKEVESYSHLELIRRARWIKRNVGFAKRCINGLANMVGYLSPRALTKDKDWNKAAEANFEAGAGSAFSFDKTGRFNVYGYQPLLTRSRFMDGDILSVLTESDTGSGRAMVMTYEGHQVRDLAAFGAGSMDARRSMGITTNDLGRHLAYRVVADLEKGDYVDIPAADAILHADFDSFGWQRGVTILHTAINHFLDETEIISDVKLAIKAAGRIGYYEKVDSDQLGTKVPGIADAAAAAANLKKAVAPKGGSYLLEDTFRGGKIPELGPGREIKMLLDERPHPNSVAFLEHLNRDIAWGIGISSDVLWNIAKLGGASVRYVLADAQLWVETQQQLLVDQFLTRFWIYYIAKEMKAGRLPRCKDPEWYKVGWTPQAKLTVDISRDGKLAVDLHRAGMLTMKRWYGMQGIDDEAEDAQKVEEYARRLILCLDKEKELKAKGYDIRIDPERVFPTGVPGAASQSILGPDGQPVSSASAFNEPAFSAEERFTRIEGTLDDIVSRFGLAA